MKTKLGTLLKIKQGFAFKSQYYVEKSNYRLVTLGNFSNQNAFEYNNAKATYYGDSFPPDFILKENDLIMPLTEQVVGLFGNSAFIPKEDKFQFVLNQRVARIDCDETKIDKYYLHYLLATKEVKKQLEARATGTRQRNISSSDVYDVEVIIPDLKTQKVIGNFLYNIEKKQENNNKINAELESLAKTIYDYWFLQFEFPNEEGKPYKSSGGKMVWNEELKREIPEGWKLGVISDFIKEEKGGDWGKESQDEKYKIKVNCIRGADFPAMTGNENLKAPTRFILEKNKYKVLSDGDVIVEISGGSPTQSTGRICYINSNTLNRFSCDVITSNFCKAFSLKNKSYLYWFYLMWQKLLVSNVFFNFEGKTTGIKNLQFDVLTKGYKICIPPEQLITKFHNAVENLYLKIQKNQENNQELSSLRDFLLPMLMNGQISFSDDI